MHRLRAELGGAHVFRPAFRCREFRLIARQFGQPGRVLERVQCARHASLLVLVFRRPAHVRHERQRLVQRLCGLRHGCGAFLETGGAAVGCDGQRSVYGSAYRFDRARNRPPHPFRSRDRGCEGCRIETPRQRRGPVGQKPLDEPGEPADHRHQDQDADDVIRRMIGSQQRHAVEGVRGADDERHGDGKQSQCDQGRDHLEQDIGERQPLGGRARADGRHCGTGRRSDVLPDDQRAALVHSNRAGVIGRERDSDGCRRRLHHRGHHEPNHNQRQKAKRAGRPTNSGRPEDGGQVRRMQALGEPSHALLQRRQSEKHKREAGERSPSRRDASTAKQPDQRTNEDHRQCVGGQRDADPDERHEPASPRGADIGAEDQAQPLRKGQQAGAHQSDRRHGRRTRGLHKERDHGAPERAGQRGRRRLAQHRAQRGARERLEPLGHDRHAKQEQADAAKDRDRRRHERAFLRASPKCWLVRV